jgi:histidinol-phosphate aminotransferase
LKQEIGKVKGVNSEQIFLGNGSDEGIDILIRAFCEPKEDNIVSISPSYGMYQVCADTHGVETIKAQLETDFSLNARNVLKAITPNSKIIFLCSPNNPTGNNLDEAEIRKILHSFKGIVVIDEAYIDFSPENTKTSWLADYKQLVILQTFSKAWGLAGIRLGMAFASEEIIAVMNKIKMPYNVNELTQRHGIKAIKNVKQKELYVFQILTERDRLKRELSKLELVQGIYPSDANFLLIKTNEPNRIYTFLIEQKIVIRNRSSIALCEGCLRITVGRKEENDILLDNLRLLK